MEIERQWILPDLGSAEGYPPPGTLTSTAISGWMTCARCWALDNLEHQTKPGSAHFPVGTAIHHAAECVGRTILGDTEAPSTPEDILESSLGTLKRELNKECGRNGTEIVPPTESEVTDAQNTTRRLVEFAIPHFYRLFVERGLVTQEYVLPLFLNPFPFPMTGRCDAIYGGPKVQRPLLVGDFKTANQMRRPDQNNRVQGGIYCLFVEQEGTRPGVVFDTITKAANPKIESFGLGREGSSVMGDSELMVVRETVMDVAAAISDGYQAWLNQDWAAYRRHFPIGQGWNGRHDYDHGLPEAHPRIAA